MPEITLKDGTKVKDPRLGRCIDFNSKSRAFPIRTLVEKKKPRSYTWDCDKVLNQGKEGACVGFGISHNLIAKPLEVYNLSNKTAQELYFGAQKEDPWEGGAYPGASPFYEGTSVLAGLKVAQNMGYLESYRWAFGVTDLILGIGYHGPAILGTWWYDDMYKPNSNNYITPTGELAGGHCYIATGVDWEKERFEIVNSWGPKWGNNGRAYISFMNMLELLKQDGEAVFVTKRPAKS